MGEIIYSLSIGALLVATGIAMNAILRREEKRVCGEDAEKGDAESGGNGRSDT